MRIHGKLALNSVKCCRLAM
uniref:Uncharacterized protein n=1 Tax=Anguilla anguilla TaxID=7936 RepID=A0A0E9T227_ANGAN